MELVRACKKLLHAEMHCHVRGRPPISRIVGIVSGGKLSLSETTSTYGLGS